MGSVAFDGIQSVSSISGAEGSIVIPADVLYTGAKAQWRNVISPNGGGLLEGSDKLNETALVPLRVNPESGGLWVDISLSRRLTKKSGRFTALTGSTKSVELILNASVTQAIYLSYVSYQILGGTAELYFSYGGASTNLGTGMATPTSSAFLRNKPTDGSIIAKDFGDARVLAGSTQQSLWLNVLASTPAPDVIWNLFYSLEDHYYGI